jgi:small subunit ribosomal protein S9
MAEFFCGTGRRKSSIARVRVVSGTGKIVVNEKEISAYFGRQILQKIVCEPLEVTSTLDKFDIMANVEGGGIHGQADAVSLGIARALSLADPAVVPVLKKASLLTRDSRMKERKKYGKKGARGSFQWSKR